MDYTLNCNGRLLSLATPQVMGIVNVTPDSFFAGSRRQTETEIAERVEDILTQGGTIIDVGACSTRPGSDPVSEEEEAKRLRKALTVIRRVAPESVISVDTFRPAVARMVVEEFGADIINDVGATATLHPSHSTLHPSPSTLHPSPSTLHPSPSTLHPSPSTQHAMFRMVSRLRVPYIYMSCKATMRDVLLDCAEAVDLLRSMGQRDIVLDPGFGFGKTLEENYQVMQELERMQMTGLPMLVGISRKSMIYKLLDSNPQEALNGTTALNTIALMKGASILRVHDVREAVECVRIVESLKLGV